MTGRDILVSALRDRLRSVVDPELGLDVVELGMIGEISVDEHGIATVPVALTTSGCPRRAQIKSEVQLAAQGLSGITAVRVPMSEMSPQAKSLAMNRARQRAQSRATGGQNSPRTRIVAVASGKGGVGKSSVTANLSLALALRGLRVGLMDADVSGFSIPHLLAAFGPLRVERGRIQPHSVPVGSGGVEVMSIGLLAESDRALMWRGLMQNRAVQHFIEDVDWGNLDYLVIDTPPGTADIHMGLARLLPQTQVLLVTTPGEAAEVIAGRAGDLAARHSLRIIGVVENMSYFLCRHGDRYQLFGAGGGERLAQALDVPLVARIPLDPAIAEGSNTGQPVALDPSQPAAAIFTELARELALKLAPPLMDTDCTARLIESLEAALGPLESGPSSA
jgi:ATP-binding protein involved in chromosome partitioning